MLYGNAQLARVYLDAWQVARDEFFQTITEEILDYVIREMTDVNPHQPHLSDRSVAQCLLDTDPPVS